jgi:aminopeptidase N
MSGWAYAALALGTAIDITGAQQAADAERIRQEEIARQARENKEMVKLQAELQSTARSKVYTSFLKNSSAIAGFNRRGDDRSLKAIQKAGREKAGQELSAIQLQSLFTRGRYESQARFAQLEGQWAADQALMSQISTVAGNGYKAYQVYSGK